MAVNLSLITLYRSAIYLNGTRRFTARDGFTGIPLEYHQPVKENFAAKCTWAQLDNALYLNYVNQQEYDDTSALMPIPRPVMMSQDV